MNKILTLMSLLYSFSTFGQSWNIMGDNSSTGSLTIGSTVSNTYSKLTPRGLNFPHGIKSKRDIVFDFADAGEAYIVTSSESLAGDRELLKTRLSIYKKTKLDDLFRLNCLS